MSSKRSSSYSLDKCVLVSDLFPAIVFHVFDGLLPIPGQMNLALDKCPLVPTPKKHNHFMNLIRAQLRNVVREVGVWRRVCRHFQTVSWFPSYAQLLATLVQHYCAAREDLEISGLKALKNYLTDWKMANLDFYLWSQRGNAEESDAQAALMAYFAPKPEELIKLTNVKTVKQRDLWSLATKTKMETNPASKALDDLVLQTIHLAHKRNKAAKRKDLPYITHPFGFFNEKTAMEEGPPPSS